MELELLWVIIYNKTVSCQTTNGCNIIRKRERSSRTMEQSVPPELLPHVLVLPQRRPAPLHSLRRCANPAEQLLETRATGANDQRRILWL